MPPPFPTRLLSRHHTSPIIRTRKPHNPSRPYSSTSPSPSTSTTGSTAQKARETASAIQSKATEGLSRVSSTATAAASGAVAGVSGRIGRVVGVVESTIPQVMYYARVGVEVLRLVGRGQGMGLPSSQQFSNTFQPVLNAVRNPTALLQSARQQVTAAATQTSASGSAGILSRVRGMERAQWATAGVVFAEVLGFFTVGEMAGRMKFVGYRGEVHHAH